MSVTNKESGTNVNEIAAGIYRISTPVGPDFIPGGFTFNQYLIVDDEPLIFHTGLRKMFPLVREAVASVIPVEPIRRWWRILTTLKMLAQRERHDRADKPRPQEMQQEQNDE